MARRLLLVALALAPRLAHASSGSCTFESGLCGWANSGKSKWVRGTKTPSSSTGAQKAQGGSWFMFLETSSPSSAGYTSELTHAVPAGTTAVSWYFHMHGATMGTLRLEAYTKAGWKSLWSKSGQQHSSQRAAFSAAKARQAPRACIFVCAYPIPPFTFYCHDTVPAVGTAKCGCICIWAHLAVRGDIVR